MAIMPLPVRPNGWFALRQAQQRLGPRPRSFNDDAGRFGGSEGGRLTGPSLNPVDVILLDPEAAHPGGQAPLDRVRRGSWRLGGGRSPGVGGDYTATGTAAKDAADECVLRCGPYQRISPGRSDFRLGSAQKTCTDLCRTGADNECSCDAARIGDTASRDNRHIDRIDYRRQ